VAVAAMQIYLVDSSSTILMHRAKELSKILVAVDGSETSIRAAKHAFDIAGKSNSRCTLYLVHVVPPQILLAHSSGYFGAVSPSYQKGIEEEAKEWFKRISSKVRKNDHLHIVKKVISTGASIVTEIASYADRKEIELIVIGAAGKSGIRRLLLGSVSAGVVTHSHCSVLVVR
jgi:nucleotide-binding universal stress UspA family protein